MNSASNPFAPGAGTPPPELAGRDRIIEEARVALARVRAGRPARSQMLLGLRGVGKTVLLNRIAGIAAEERYLTVLLEAPEGRSLAEMLVPPLRKLLFKLSRGERVQTRARRALAVLRSFAAAFKVSVGEIEFGVEPEVGTADSGSLEADLPELLLAVAAAAKEAERAVALFVDEVQYLSAEDLAALIVSVHRMGQKGRPFVFFGAGLPQLAALAGEAKSYAERLFAFPDVGPLAADAAAEAIRQPIRRRAMAELGPGPHRSGDIARLLGEPVTAVAPLRNGLIRKGMIYSPAFGDTAFTVPMFDEFMRRSIPDWSPGAAEARREKGKKRRAAKGAGP
ncbi:MAG TPA: ATP-binding protein [Longimicrobium sp.]|nr:ATP-binding protein [Longimicrobium sp.]